MFVSIVTVHSGRTIVHQLDAPTVKDCLVAWAGRITVNGMTDEARTRLRGRMADFDGEPVEGLVNLWRIESDLGLEGAEPAMVVVVQTAKF